MNDMSQIAMKALQWFFSFLEIVLWARVIMSFVVMFMGRTLKIYDIICSVTEPLLGPIRALLNKSEFIRNSPLDFSIIILWILLNFIQQILFGY